jgi:hypothetical protein
MRGTRTVYCDTHMKYTLWKKLRDFNIKVDGIDTIVLNRLHGIYLALVLYVSLRPSENFVVTQKNIVTCWLGDVTNNS